MKELHDIMIEEEEEQKVKKRKKYLRDVEDYKSHNIFKWQENDCDFFINHLNDMEGCETSNSTSAPPSSEHFISLKGTSTPGRKDIGPGRVGDDKTPQTYRKRNNNSNNTGRSNGSYNQHPSSTYQQPKNSGRGSNNRIQRHPYVFNQQPGGPQLYPQI